MDISLITDECSHDPFAAMELGLKWGISRFEIRYAYRWRLPFAPDWACDLTVAAMKGYGATVTAISPGLFKPVMQTDGSKTPISMDTPDEIRRHVGELLSRSFVFAERLATRKITLFALPKPAGLPDDAPIPAMVIDTLGVAAQRAQAEGFTLLLENGQGSWADTGQASGKILAAVNSPALRMTWDPANVIHGGFAEDPVSTGYKHVQPYIGNMHVKDATFADGKGHWVMLGDGVVDWNRQLRLLQEMHYSGCLTVEPHLQYESPLHLIQKTETFVGRLRGMAV